MLKLCPSIALTGREIWDSRNRFQRYNILNLEAVENERNPSENMSSFSVFFKNFVIESGWPNVLHFGPISESASHHFVRRRRGRTFYKPFGNFQGTL